VTDEKLTNPDRDAIAIRCGASRLLWDIPRRAGRFRGVARSSSGPADDTPHADRAS
jgi:hypothetical protein